MVTVECPECGMTFEAEPDVLLLANRFYCSLCDALLEVIEEEPLLLDVIEEDDTEDDEEGDWEA